MTADKKTSIITAKNVGRANTLVPNKMWRVGVLKIGDCTCQNKELHQRVKKEKTLHTNKLFDYRLTFIEVIRKKIVGFY